MAFILVILIYGCGGNAGSFEEISVDLRVVRFEQELFNVDIYNADSGFRKLAAKYPGFMPLFSNRIIEIGDTAGEWFAESMLMFVTDQAMYNIFKQVSEVFPGFDEQKKELDRGFSKFHSFFPEKDIPDVYTYISGFNQTMVTAEGILGISLEKYLGGNCCLYDEVYPPIPRYQRYRMNPSNIAPDALKAWASTEFEYLPKQNDLLSRMLYEGRNMFLLKQIFPEIADSVLWSFTLAQMDFCTKNEKYMWTYLIEQKLLFSTNQNKNNQFIEEAPFTKDFSVESPGRTGVWIGYRIIDNYYRKNKVGLEQLMLENDYQKILNGSKYRP
ncbi:MAG: hypothetical protein JXB34_03390 [Bacteroidales bacterium]|nr:hypothetical protein [Bacteroidales bacterium]